MAVVVENEYNDAVAKKSTSHTITSVVVPTSSDRAIYVLIGSSQKTSGGSKFVTAVDFNGSETFTKIGEAQNGKVTVAVWRLLAPTQTTASIDVTYTDNNAAWNGGSIGVQVLSSVDSDTPEDAWEAPSTGDSTAPAHTITSSAGDYAVDIIAALAPTAAPTENGDGVQNWTDSTNTPGFASADLETSGNASMAWTLASSTVWIHGGVSINPAASGTTFNEVHTYTALGSNTLIKIKTGVKTLTYAAIGTTVLTKLAEYFRAFTYTGLGTLVLSKKLFASFSYASIGTMSFAKGLLFTIAGTFTATATSVVTKILTAVQNFAYSSVGTLAISKLSTFVRVFSYTVTAIVQKSIQVSKSLSYSALGTLNTATIFISIQIKTFSAVATIAFSKVFTAFSEGITRAKQRTGTIINSFFRRET